MPDETKFWYVLHLRRAMESRCFDMETRTWVKRLEQSHPQTYERLCVIAAEHGEQALLQTVMALRTYAHE